MPQSQSLLKILREYICIEMYRNRAVFIVYLYFNILVCFYLGIIPLSIIINEPPTVSATKISGQQSPVQGSDPHPYYSFTTSNNRGEGQSLSSNLNRPVPGPGPGNKYRFLTPDKIGSPVSQPQYSQQKKQGADYLQFQKILRAQLKSEDKFELHGNKNSNPRAEKAGGGGGWGWKEEKKEEEDDLIDRLWATMGPLLFPIPFFVASIPFAIAAIPISFFTRLNDSFSDG